MGHSARGLALLAAIGCGSGEIGGGGIGDPSADGGGDRAGDSGVEPEVQPDPVEGPGLSDPPTSSLRAHGCGGTDWQRIHGWLLHPHQGPDIGPVDQADRCVELYAGWVTNEADAAGVSRSSVYARLAATGQCDEWNGAALLPPALCVLANPELDEEACVAGMAASRGFGIASVARALEAGVDEHDRDVPRMGAWLAEGAVACGEAGRFRLRAPEGAVESYVAAYNAIKARSSAPPECGKRIVVTVALYTGMDDPGVDGVAAANGCWTYERVSKTNAEWKICNYDGTVFHESGVKWVYDDTSSAHDTTTEVNRINGCKSGTSGRGYVYMANRGGGWPKRVTEGVRRHFAEVYSSQFQVDDQFGLWKSSGEPGDPMIHLGEASTSATRIADATRRACAEVEDGGFLGVYLYPESLRDSRMSAMVRELNACTE
jgi:hypothetical protein